MAGNFYGELVIRITSDTAGLKKGLAESEAAVTSVGDRAKTSSRLAAQRMEHVGRQMQNIGRQMTQFVTVPIAAGFAVAAVSAFKFQDQLMKIQNLTGTSAAQTKAWGDELLKLGAATGQTPIKLAESLYFVASSGFKGAEAMDVIEVSAKAAAAGLGDVMVTADVLTSAMNSYGHQTYTAAEVTDYLMKTIEVGKAEPVALATSLGRIMPVANQLKIGLDELGGNVAALTLGGLSSAEAVTALRGTMIALVAPAKMSIDQLKTMGLTYKDVKRSIADEGLLPTLKMLWEEVDHNELAMRKLIPNTRALNGVLSLLGANYEYNLDVIEKVSDAQGTLDRAMKNTAEQPVQKLRKAWASLQGEFIKIGAVILPVIADLAKSFASLVESFNKLSPGWRDFLLKAAATAAVLGPVVMVTGTMVNSLGLIRGLLIGMIKPAAAVTAGMGGASSAAVGLGSAIGRLALAAGPIGLVITAAAALTYGLVKANQALYDTKNILSTTTAADILKRSGYKTDIETNVKVKLITAEADSKIAKYQRLKGNIVLTVDDVKAWAQVEALNAYVNDPSKWVVPARMHLTPAENLAEVQKTVQEYGAKPLSLHTQVSPRQLRLQASMITDIFEKIPPIDIPANIKMGTASDKEYKAWWKSLTDKQRLIIEPQIKMGASVQNAGDRVEKLKQQLIDLGKLEPTPEVKGDISDVTAKLRRARADLRSASREYAEMRIKGVDEYSYQINRASLMLNNLPSEKVIRIIASGPGPISMHSMGGIVKKPEITLVGEDGPEVILPLSKPARMATLMRQAGLEGYGRQAGMPARTLREAPRLEAVNTGPREVHYHSHVAVPQGIVVDDTQRFAQRLAPWQWQQMKVAERRRKRGVATF